MMINLMMNLPYPARGKGLSLIPDIDPGYAKTVANNDDINKVSTTPCNREPDPVQPPVPLVPPGQPAQETPVPPVPPAQGIPPVPPLQDTQDRVIVASDVEALYPSLDVRAVKKTVFKHVFTTQVQFKDINYKDTAEYIAVCAKPWEIRLWKLHNIIPTKRSKSGRKPTIQGKHNMTSNASDTNTPWRHPNRDPTEYEKRAYLQQLQQLVYKPVLTCIPTSLVGPHTTNRAGPPLGLTCQGTWRSSRWWTGPSC